jgi:TPR repeat protein
VEKALKGDAEASLEEAVKWYKFSAKQGNESAIATLKIKGITDYE